MPTRSKDTKLRTFDSKAFFQTTGAGHTVTTYRKDRKVFAQGDAADTIFYIVKGKVKITVFSEQGKEAVVAILGPDEFFGEACMNGQKVRSATVRTMSESEIVQIDQALIKSIIAKEPIFAEMFIAHLLTRSIRIEEDLVDQLFNSSEKRLARALLLLANFAKDGTSQKVITKISQETLAEMIGTTRSRVSHFMNKFRKLGLINYNGHLEVYPALLNVVLHDRPQIQGMRAAKKSAATADAAKRR